MKKKICALLLIFLSLSLLFSCSKDKYNETNFYLMDTFAYIKALGASKQDFEKVENTAFEVERLLSKTIETSDVSRINTAGENVGVELSKTAADVIRTALYVCENTDGALNIALGRVTSLWDFKSLSPSLPKTEDIENAISHIDFNRVKISDRTVTKADADLSLDLGACAKGYCAKLICDELETLGVENAMVSLGGNVGVIGNSNKHLNDDGGWDVGIRNPFDPGGILGYVSVTDTVIAVSGDYERCFEFDGIKYFHILASDGYPARSGISSAAVICPDGTLADSLSTALFVMGVNDALEFYKSGIYDFEAILCTNGGDVYVTPGIRSSFFESENAAGINGYIYCD